MSARLHYLLAGLALALNCGASQAAKYGCDTAEPKRHVLLMEGGIKEKEAQRFFAAFNQCFPGNYAGQVVVDLFSGGGLVNEALDIANALIRYGKKVSPVMVRVSARSYCISACTYLFVAGTMREVRPGGSLEPHGFSGYRGARMVTDAADALKDGKIDPEKVSINAPAVRLLSQLMTSLAITDPRFAWLGEWLKNFNRKDGRFLVIAPARLVEEYLAMNEAQKRAVDGLESSTTVVMTELERVAALRTFDGLMGPQRSPGNPGEQETEHLQRWMLKEFLDSLNGYLLATRQGPLLKNLEVIAAEVRDVQSKEIRSTQAMAVNDLWPYLSSRDDVMDMASFVRLMFSTSIIYMRPLTHEELCDFNLDSTSCG
jgi:hypothetical protein